MKSEHVLSWYEALEYKSLVHIWLLKRVVAGLTGFPAAGHDQGPVFYWTSAFGEPWSKVLLCAFSTWKAKQLKITGNYTQSRP